MDNKKYQKSALRTNGPDYQGVIERLTSTKLVEYNSGEDTEKSLDLLHASMGMVTEAGEFMDMMKKHLFYGKPQDTTNLKEEIGDILWYAAIALEALDTNFEEVMETNIAKLKARYPEKFTEDKALNRNLDTEREILED